MRSRLDTCWVQDLQLALPPSKTFCVSRQERCVSGQTQTLTTVCKPDGRASTSPHESQIAVTCSDHSKGECQHFAAKANVLGFATLLVTGPARFAAQSGVDSALGSALAQLVPSLVNCWWPLPRDWTKIKKRYRACYKQILTEGSHFRDTNHYGDSQKWNMGAQHAGEHDASFARALAKFRFQMESMRPVRFNPCPDGSRTGDVQHLRGWQCELRPPAACDCHQSFDGTSQQQSNHPSHELGTHGTRQVATAKFGNKEVCLDIIYLVCVGF